ncbi:uncharacterized protein LOC143908831 isoform X2 [Temnothorax americanus]|uniref:uncharacterized protein LOC143908831 isoform X2 n=1 Tax=Temnothorax americanus TaxID=1964332 RepID=UPI0040680E23
MYRRKWDPVNSKTSLAATDSIIVTFKDKNIRDLTVFDKGIALRVRRYVPQVRQCFNCFRFGHTKLNCKSETRCIICGDKAHGRCEREQRCYNCGGQHKSTFKGCPQYDKTKNINIVMAHRNVSFYSARQIVEGVTPDSSQEFQNKLINPASWPGLALPAGPSSYSEALRSVPRAPSGSAASTQRDKRDHPPPYSTKDKRRTAYEAPQNFYKSFDLRTGEITREKRGIMFSASHRGGSEIPSKDNYTRMEHQEDQRITETIENILLLLRRVPGARIKLIRALALSGTQDGQEGGLPQHSDNSQIYEKMENRESSRTIQSRNLLGSGGVSVSVRLCIEFDILPIVGTPPAMYDMVGIKTSNLENNINIVAVYRHPRAGMSARDLNAVFNSINPSDSIILGDFNAHNTAWNCESSNNNGDILHDVMANAGLICINVDTRSRIGCSGQRDFNIDLLFASGSVAGNIDYQQLGESHDSDHVPIGFFVDINTRIYRKLSNKTSTKRTDWSQYREIVEKEIDRSMAPALPMFRNDFEKYYQDFIFILKSAVFRASGRRGDPNRPRPVDPRKIKRSHRWWNSDCDAAIRERRRAFTEFKRLRNIQAWTNYKRHCAVTKKILNQAKKENFENFCKSINRFTSLSYVWSTMRILKNTRKNIEWNKWQTKDRESEIRKTIDGLAPPYVGTNPSGEPEYLCTDEELDAPFIRSELDRAIRMVRRDSAPGMDGVEYQMLRLLPESDKAGKEKVRPISLSSCVGKLMERMINERLIWWAEKEGKFSRSQNGFRRGRSCADNLARITSDIRAALSAREYTLAAFLDVSSAYDSVEFRIMLDGLMALGCPAGMVNFVRNWLYRRKVRFIVNSGEHIDRFVFRGLPQGAVLSPALYSLFTRTLYDALPEGVEMVEFADNIGMYVSGQDRQRNRLLLEQAVNIIATTLGRIGLDLEPKKTVLVEFNRNGYVDKNMTINIQGCKVCNNDGAKFLGIWLDNSLKFNRQVQDVRGKVNRANSVMRYLCRVARGMEVNTALMLYKSLVRSITDYGIFVYFPRDSASQIKLERTQYMGIRTALGYRNSTPNNVLIAEAKVMLLRDRAIMLGSNFVTGAIAYNRSGLCDKLQRLLDRESYCRFRQPTYKFSMLSEIWKKLRFRTGIGRSRQFEIFQGPYMAHTFEPCVDLAIGESRKCERYPDELLIRKIIETHCVDTDLEIVYTDGSYEETCRSTGASMVIEDQDIAFKMNLPGTCSSYTAEVFAIKSALQLMIQQHSHRKKIIIIMSDCKSALQAFQNNHINVHKNRYVTEARRYIYDLEVNFDKRIILVWIPAHVGIAGNEQADALAREAALEEADRTIEVPVGDFRRQDRSEAWNATQRSIVRDAAHKGIFYFDHFYDDVATKPWFHKINAERYFVTLFNRLRANHFNLGSSLKRKGYIDNERCECGYEREDLYHVLLTCHKYDDYRIEMDKELRDVNYLENIDLMRIIKTKNWDVLYIIFKFFKKIGKVI